jgi:hypothetical protein
VGLCTPTAAAVPDSPIRATPPCAQGRHVEGGVDGFSGQPDAARPRGRIFPTCRLPGRGLGTFFRKPTSWIGEVIETSVECGSGRGRFPCRLPDRFGSAFADTARAILPSSRRPAQRSRHRDGIRGGLPASVALPSTRWSAPIERQFGIAFARKNALSIPWAGRAGPVTDASWQRRADDEPQLLPSPSRLGLHRRDPDQCRACRGGAVRGDLGDRARLPVGAIGGRSSNASSRRSRRRRASCSIRWSGTN